MPSLKILLITLIISAISPAFSADSLEELVEKADAALEQYEYQAALIHLKNAARQSPDNLPVRLKMARIFVHIGQGIQADVEIDKANRLGARPVDTAVLSAKAKMLQGKFEDLIENIDLLDLPQAEIARLRAIQGHALYEQRNFYQAKKMFQRALRLSPTELEVELGQARLFQLDGEVEKEQKLVSSLLKRHRQDADVLIIAGNYYREKGEFERALEIFAEAGEIQPSNVNVWFGVVRSYIGMRNFNDAKIEIQSVLSNYPEHQVGNYLLSVIAFQEGDYTRARAAIEIVLKGEKRKFEALKLLGIIQFQQLEYSEAEKSLKKYLEFHAEDTQALKTLAAIYLKRKQGTLALEVLKQLENLDDAYIYSMFATAYMHLGDKARSELYIQKSMQMAPDDAEIKRHIQRSKLASGDTLEIDFTDTDFDNFMSEGQIPILNLLSLKQYDKAIEVIRGYMETIPDSPLLHYLLGSTLFYQGKTDAARVEFQQSVQLNPRLVESRIYLAKLSQLDGNERDAEREFREVLRIQQNNDQALVALAGIYHRAGDEEEMLKWLNKSRRQNTASLASREILHDYYRQKDEIINALEISGEMVKIQPQNVALLLKLANDQKANNRVDLAIETFGQIVQLKPELPSAWFGLGRLQYISKNYADAELSFQKALKLEPQNITAKVILIQIDLKSKKFQSALLKAKNLIQQHPESPAGFDMLGDVYIELDKPDMAIQQYQQSVKLKYSSDTYIKLHSAYNRNNQVTKGFTELKLWTRQNPDDLQLKEVLAITYQRNGEFEKARDLYEEIIQKSRRNDRVLNNLALVALALESPMSLEYAEMAFNLNPQSIRNKDTLGWVLLKNNNLQKGLDLLKEATEASPGDSDIRYHYAVALVAHGKITTARNQLNLAIGTEANFANKAAAEKLLKELNNS